MRKNAKKKLLAVALIGTLLCSTALSGIAVAADGDVDINDTNFPDPVFQQYVKDNYDTDGDNVLSQNELENATSAIGIENSELSDLTGIKYFTNVKTIMAASNKLTDIDVSQNPNLTGLYLVNCPIEDLDVSSNHKLRFLTLFNTQITALDLRQNPELESIGFTDTPITALDLRQNSKLRDVILSIPITALDLSQNDELNYVELDNCNLIALDLINDPTFTNFSVRNNSTNLGEIPSDSYDLKEIVPTLDGSKISNIKGATINGTVISNYKEGTPITYDYNTGNTTHNFALQPTLTFTVKEMDTDKYEATGGTIDKKSGETVTADEITEKVTVTPTPDGQVTKTVNGDIPTTGKGNLVKVTVTYADNSTDVATVTVNFEDQPTTPTETETKPATEPATEPTTEAVTNPTTEPATEAETKPVATSSNATKNGSKSSGSKKPSASTNGLVGPADNTNTNTTEPTANTNEAMVAADNANTDGTESLVNAAMKGMLPKTGDMMNLNLTLAGLLGSLTGLVGLVASKKRKKS